MKLRDVLFALMIAAAPWSAFAQESEPAPVEASVPTAASEAVRTVYLALFFETGIFDTMTERFLPEYRRIATNSAYYRGARRDDRAALDRVIEDTPRFLREEVIAETFVMADNVSVRAEALLSPEDMFTMAEFLRDPRWRPFMQRMAVHGAVNGPDDSNMPDITAEEDARMNAYAGANWSPRLLENGTVFMSLLVEEMQAASPRLLPRVQLRLANEICTALANRCPRELRELTRTF